MDEAQTMMKRILSSLTLALALTACGPAGEVGEMPSGLDPGFSSCSAGDLGVTCQPGQYCADANTATCALGCLSDLNCASGQTCQKDPGANLGSCQSGAMTPPSNNTPSNNSTGNNTPGSNSMSPTPATCDAACAQVEANCGASVDVSGCLPNCQAGFTQAQRDCLVGTTTCADAQACLPAPMEEEEGLLGSACLSRIECKSDYCQFRPGGFEGTCAENDFAAACQRNDECVHNACIRADGSDFGYCTASCRNFSDCPPFWKCEAASNGSGAMFCFQDN